MGWRSERESCHSVKLRGDKGKGKSLHGVGIYRATARADGVSLFGVTLYDLLILWSNVFFVLYF